MVKYTDLSTHFKSAVNQQVLLCSSLKDTVPGEQGYVVHPASPSHCFHVTPISPLMI